jgi:hypothetical protein
MSTSTLTFQTTTPAMLISVIVVLVTAFLCQAAWRRSGCLRSVGLLEGLRFCLVLSVAVLLNQPEWIEEIRPPDRPTVVVLWDDSGSMATRDVLNDERPGNPPVRRSEWVQPLLDADLWQAASDRVKIVFEPFSSSEGSPDGTDINTALKSVPEKHLNLRAVVLLSDGDWNEGEAPAAAATKLRLKGVPVFGVGVGSETALPDIQIVSLDAPTFGVAGKAARIPFTIRSSLSRDYPVVVTLESSDGQRAEKQILIPAMGQLSDALSWQPETVGDFELTLKVPPSDAERIPDNNEQTVPIAIRKEALQVLLIESFPRWEYRYFRNALERDPGVEVSCLLFHPNLPGVGGGRGYLREFPAGLDELSRYDVIMLGDVGTGEGQLTAEQCRLLKGLVQNQASGLILMPGLRGHQFSLLGTELSELYPVVLDEAQPRGWGSRIPQQFELTEAGRRSLLTRLTEPETDNAKLWESLPGFQWFAPVLRARAGSEVLAIHHTETNRYGRIPLLVTRSFGTGKILFMGTDGAWRWREGVEDLYHYRFWGQVARWMAYQRNMAEGESMRLFYSPDRPAAGDVVTLNANVMSATGEPLQNGNVVVQVLSPAGRTETVRLSPRGEDWGLFTGTFHPLESGDYELTMTCRENGSTLKTTLSVQGTSREQIGQPARFEVLEEIAAISRGRSVTTSEFPQLIRDVAELPEPEPVIRRLRLWCHPVTAGALILLLGCFWTGRKMAGAI